MAPLQDTSAAKIVSGYLNHDWIAVPIEACSNILRLIQLTWLQYSLSYSQLSEFLHQPQVHLTMERKSERMLSLILTIRSAINEAIPFAFLT